MSEYFLLLRAQLEELGGRLIEEWGLAVSDDRAAVRGKREQLVARQRQRELLARRADIGTARESHA